MEGERERGGERERDDRKLEDETDTHTSPKILLLKDIRERRLRKGGRG